MEKKHLLFGVLFSVILLTIFNRKKIADMLIDTREALKHKNVKAFLALIRKHESGGVYNVIYGGQKFNDFSTHPNTRVPFFNPATQKKDYSTAAGAYQIINGTYKMLKNIPNVPTDFSPETQDIMAVTLLKLRGALGHIIAGDWEMALMLASKEWASLPYSESKQNKITLAAATNFLKGGAV